MEYRYRNVVSLLALCLLSILSASVHAQSQSAVLIGTWYCPGCWIIEPADGTATWQLNADGTYLLTVRSKDKKDKNVWKERGTWSGDEKRIIRNNKTTQVNNDKPYASDVDGITFHYTLSEEGKTLTLKDSNLTFVFKRRASPEPKGTGKPSQPTLAPAQGGNNKSDTQSPTPNKTDSSSQPLKPGTLYAAAREGNLKQLKLLLAKGASVNAKDPSGKTALHYAAENGRLEAAKLLVEKKADINSKDAAGNTPLAAARKAPLKGDSATAANAMALIINWLSDHGASE